MRRNRRKAGECSLICVDIRGCRRGSFWNRRLLLPLGGASLLLPLSLLLDPLPFCVHYLLYLGGVVVVVKLLPKGEVFVSLLPIAQAAVSSPPDPIRLAAVWVDFDSSRAVGDARVRSLQLQQDLRAFCVYHGCGVAELHVLHVLLQRLLQVVCIQRLHCRLLCRVLSVHLIVGELHLLAGDDGGERRLVVWEPQRVGLVGHVLLSVLLIFFLCRCIPERLGRQRGANLDQEVLEKLQIWLVDDRRVRLHILDEGLQRHELQSAQLLHLLRHLWARRTTGARQGG
mmetsp:Transcript_34118/g.97580  ORF Transcript_34118/g.97580 Transcript_34118/m.97580 type:complete len:285 (+) Transcript_34118:319-1173(+)